MCMYIYIYIYTHIKLGRSPARFTDVFARLRARRAKKKMVQNKKN